MFIFRIFLLLLLGAHLSFFNSATADTTAQKVVVRASSLQPSPQAFFSKKNFTARMIDKTQSYQTTDSVIRVPGVYVTQQGLPGSFTKVEMRGMPSYNTFVSQDNMCLNDPGIGGAFDFSNESARDTELIQVIVGARALRYDPRAGSGAIIMKSKEGQGPQSLFTTLEGGTYKSGLLSVGSEARTDVGRYYTAVSGQRTGAGSTVNQKRGNLLSDYYTALQGIATINAQITPLYELKMSVRGSESTISVNESGNQLEGRFFPVKSDNTSTVNRHLLTLNNKFVSLDKTLTQEVYLGHAQTRTLTEYNGDDFVTEGTTQKLQYKAVYTPRKSYAITASIAHERDVALVPNVDRFSAHFNHAMGEIALKCTKALTLTTGGRVIKHRLFESKFSYWGIADYAFNNQTTFSTAAGLSHRFPLVMDLYQTHPEKIGNPNLTPEKIVNFDIGMHHKFLGNQLVGKVTYFRTHLNNIIVTRSLGLNQYQKVNDGYQKAEGVELELLSDLSSQTTLSGSYTFVSAQESRTKSAPAYLPRHKISFNVEHSISQQFHVFLNYNFASSRNDMDYSIFPPHPVQLASTHILRLGGTYKMAHNVEAYARIENALNKHFDNVYGYGARELSVYVGLKAKLGGCT